nr:hypothetical protein [uncultured Draconibacterium sp.]
MQQTIPKQKAFSSFSIIVVFLAFIIIGMAFIPQLDIRFKPSRSLPQLKISFYYPMHRQKLLSRKYQKLKAYWEKSLRLNLPPLAVHLV